MKSVAAGALAITLAATSVAQAGGVSPAIIEDAPVLVEDHGSSFGSMSPGVVIGALLLVAVIAAIASHDDDNKKSPDDGD